MELPPHCRHVAGSVAGQAQGMLNIIEDVNRPRSNNFVSASGVQ
jgi:hypothetical protein